MIDIKSISEYLNNRYLNIQISVSPLSNPLNLRMQSKLSYGRPHKYCNCFIRDSIGNIWKSGIPKGMSSLLKWCRILANNRPGNSQNIHIQQRKQPQGRSAPLWGAAEGRAFAFFVEYEYSENSPDGCWPKSCTTLRGRTFPQGSWISIYSLWNLL